MANYTQEARRKKILDFLHDRQEADVSQLVMLTLASEATIRRDLLELEAEGLLVRTIGGARITTEQSLVTRTFQNRSQNNLPEKKAIAEAAASLVKPHMTVLIDSGTTCWNLTSRLAAVTPLTVITPALAVIETLGDVSDIELILCGGKFRLANLDFIGPLVDFSSFHADLLFLGCDSFIPGRGAFSLDMQSAEISQRMAASADRVILLADHTKFQCPGQFRVLSPDRISDVFIDSYTAQDIQTRLQDDPYRLHVCEVK